MILISGEALIDLIPDPEKSAAYDAVLGGSPYNVAIGLGRLAETGFLSRISTDGNGEALAGGLRDNSVDISPSSPAIPARRRSLSSCAEPRRLDRATPSISTERPMTARGRSRKNGPSARASARRIVLGGRAARGIGRGAMKHAGAYATVSYDPNIRPFVTPDRDSVATLVERQASLAMS